MRLPSLLPIAAATVIVAPGIASAQVAHTVARGESLSSVAAADGLSVDQLAAANGLSSNAQLMAGSTLSIPPQSGGAGAGPSAAAGSAAQSPGATASAAPAVASAGVAHTVAVGESLSSVAAADGLSVDQLAAANDLSSNAQLLAGSTLTIPPQTSSAGAGGTSAGSGATPSAASSAAPAGSTASGGGSYVVQPGDTLSGIAARAGTSVSQLAAANGLDPNGLLPSGIALRLSPASAVTPAPTQAPAVGTTVVGRMTWFGGPDDPGAQGAPASGLGWRTDGMSYYNYGSLGHHWLVRFPWDQTLNMTQIDIGPAPWTGNPFDIAFSALPNTPYGSWNWPNPVVTGIYQGG